MSSTTEVTKQAKPNLTVNTDFSISTTHQDTTTPKKTPSSTTGENKTGLDNGRWSEQEHELFLKAIEEHGTKNWKKVAEAIPTRTIKQVRTHAQKYYLKLNKDRERKLHPEKFIKKRKIKTDESAQLQQANFMQYYYIQMMQQHQMYQMAMIQRMYGKYNEKNGENDFSSTISSENLPSSVGPSLDRYGNTSFNSDGWSSTPRTDTSQLTPPSSLTKQQQLEKQSYHNKNSNINSNLKSPNTFQQTKEILLSSLAHKQDQKQDQKATSPKTPKSTKNIVKVTPESTPSQAMVHAMAQQQAMMNMAGGMNPYMMGAYNPYASQSYAMMAQQQQMLMSQYYKNIMHTYDQDGTNSSNTQTSISTSRSTDYKRDFLKLDDHFVYKNGANALSSPTTPPKTPQQKIRSDSSSSDGSLDGLSNNLKKDYKDAVNNKRKRPSPLDAHVLNKPDTPPQLQQQAQPLQNENISKKQKFESGFSSGDLNKTLADPFFSAPSPTTHRSGTNNNDQTLTPLARFAQDAQLNEFGDINFNFESDFLDFLASPKKSCL